MRKFKMGVLDDSLDYQSRLKRKNNFDFFHKRNCSVSVNISEHDKKLLEDFIKQCSDYENSKPISLSFLIKTMIDDFIVRRLED